MQRTMCTIYRQEQSKTVLNVLVDFWMCADNRGMSVIMNYGVIFWPEAMI